MRTLDPAFAAHIKSGATTLCTCWRIARTDGVTLGFTDHDVALRFDETDFLPAHGLDGAETTAKLGAQVDTSEVTGVLHSAAITEDDILLGRYDGATVETWRVNWRDVAVRFLERRDTIGEIAREDGVFRAELRSLSQAMNRTRGRVYQSLCDARLGDARCGVDLDAPGFRVATEVDAVRDAHRIVCAGLSGVAEGWFALGTAQWTSGRRQGRTDRIVSHVRIGDEDIVALEEPAGDWVAAGDALTLTTGCDRTFATCRDRFANAVNFRGCPHIPGSDFVLKYPRPGDALNGQALFR